jgi:superfamily II DNA helicase RecQ
LISIDREKSEKDQEALNKFLLGVNVKKTSTQFISGAFNCWSVMVFYDENEAREIKPAMVKSKPVNKVEEQGEALSDQETELFNKLKSWRQKKAAELSLPVFMVCSNGELKAISKALPKNNAELEALKGFGPNKVSKFGKEILKVVGRK